MYIYICIYIHAYLSIVFHTVISSGNNYTYSLSEYYTMMYTICKGNIIFNTEYYILR